MVSIPLKNISPLGWLFEIYGKIKNVPNHQPVKHREEAPYASLSTKKQRTYAEERHWGEKIRKYAAGSIWSETDIRSTFPVLPLWVSYGHSRFTKPFKCSSNALRDLKRNYLSQQNMGGAMAHVKLPLTSSYPRKLAKRNLKRCMTVLGYFICILTKFRILDLPPSYTRLIHVGYLRFKGPTPSIAEPPEMGHHNPRARNRCQQVPPPRTIVHCGVQTGTQHRGNFTEFWFWGVKRSMKNR